MRVELAGVLKFPGDISHMGLSCLAGELACEFETVVLTRCAEILSVRAEFFKLVVA